jgi:ubiquinone/menaquinone biosynthesis C-methylase UbiE
VFEPLDTRSQKRFYDDLSEGRQKAGLLGLEKRFSPEVAVGSRSFARHFVARIDEVLRPGLRLLDLGCGTGITHPLVAPRCGSVTGAELSSGYARLARTHARRYGLDNVRIVVQDGSALAFADGCFDAALCLDVLHHVSDLERTLAELERVVRPGGDILVFEPNCMNPLLLALCVMDRNEWGAVSRCWRGRYERLFARRFELVASAWNGLLIGPQGRLATGIADFLVDGPFPGLLGRFGPEIFFHLRRRPEAR